MRRIGGRLVAALVLVAVLTLATAVSASAQEDGDGSSFVRLIHASPDAGSVDVYVDGELAVEDVTFPSATDFLELDAGTHDFDVVPTGAGIDEAVISESVDLAAGTAYDISAVGLVEEAEAVVYTVDLSAVDEGQTRVRLIHNAPDSGPVDLALGDGTVVFAGAEYPFETEYMDVEAGTYDFQVLAAGTDEVLLDLPGVSLESGTVHDLYAVGLVETGSFEVINVSAVPGEDGLPASTTVVDAAQDDGATPEPDAEEDATPVAEEEDATPVADEEDATPEAEDEVTATEETAAGDEDGDVGENVGGETEQEQPAEDDAAVVTAEDAGAAEDTGDTVAAGGEALPASGVGSTAAAGNSLAGLLLVAGLLAAAAAIGTVARRSAAR